MWLQSVLEADGTIGLKEIKQMEGLPLYFDAPEPPLYAPGEVKIPLQLYYEWNSGDPRTPARAQVEWPYRHCCAFDISWTALLDLESGAVEELSVRSGWRCRPTMPNPAQAEEWPHCPAGSPGLDPAQGECTVLRAGLFASTGHAEQ
ncbi:uncharacterized protein L969DRAFT_88101 [Mixia osmundae IAM 14324]|nr:uncharacterized protein L969DRAFT_88101 [Mixia osmundae IAM 14324]KEI38789.1 hypothetical protein L969DRAFT_88101 [Mixia osmundae IAM 14324]